MTDRKKARAGEKERGRERGIERERERVQEIWFTTSPFPPQLIKFTVRACGYEVRCTRALDMLYEASSSTLPSYPPPFSLPQPHTSPPPIPLPTPPRSGVARNRGSPRNPRVSCKEVETAKLVGTSRMYGGLVL
jgi:hypothetical protein